MTRPIPRRSGRVPCSPDGPAYYQIRTNGVPRPILYWDDLTAKEQAWHDWGAEDHTFIRYRGEAIALESYQTIDRTDPLYLAGWDGAAPDSYISGTLIRLVYDDQREESAIVAHFYTMSGI